MTKPERKTFKEWRNSNIVGSRYIYPSAAYHAHDKLLKWLEEYTEDLCKENTYWRFEGQQLQADAKQKDAKISNLNKVLDEIIKFSALGSRIKVDDETYVHQQSLEQIFHKHRSALAPKGGKDAQP